LKKKEIMIDLSIHFDKVADYRVVGRCSHKLSDILALVLLAVISDCDDFEEIVDFGEDYIDELRTHFGLGLINGIPSEDTLERVFKNLKTSELQKAYSSCLGEISMDGKHICLDGKELRSTIAPGKKHATVQMVNLWVHESGISFAQEQVAEKSNEIKAIPLLLDSVNCNGAVISIDAIGCQKEIVSKIREKDADYLIALKENQKGLYQQVQQEFELERANFATFEKREKGHGRIETRKVTVSHQLKWIENKSEWQDLKSLVMIERTREINGVESKSKQLYISSIADITPELAGRYIREHWSIENNLHWQLDFTFREDQAVLSNEVAIANLHLIRKMALTLLKKISRKISGKRKRKRIGRNIMEMAEIFQNQ
jgi:predicted transposase YbfD/YdcC